MPVYDVFDDGEAQSGAGVLAALLAFHPVEPLGEPRQVGPSDPRSAVSDPQDGIAPIDRMIRGEQREVGHGRRGRRRRRHGVASDVQTDGHRAAFGRVFERVLRQVLNHLQQLIAIPDNHGGAQGRQGRIEGDRALARQGSERVQHVDHGERQVQLAGGRNMFAQLDAREAHEIVDQAAHALGLHRHDREESLTSHRIIFGMAAQCLDETGK